MKKSDFRQQRPQKDVFPRRKQEEILNQTIEFVKSDLLPHPKINKLILFGSLARGDFGRYRQEYKGRLYSDIDILLLVENDFSVPDSWQLHFEGNRDLAGDLYQVYNYKKLDDRYLIQYMVCKEKSYSRKKNREIAERWGVPLKLENSQHAYKIIYS